MSRPRATLISHAGSLHERKGAVVDEVLRLDGEGQGEDHEVGDREEVAERLRAAQVHAGRELGLAGPAAMDHGAWRSRAARTAPPAPRPRGRCTRGRRSRR